MEFTLASLVISALLLCFALSLQVLHRKKDTKSQSKCKLPPGPWALPFIGNLHNLARDRPIYRVLLDLARSYGHVMLLRTGQTDLVVITSREAAHEVMKIHDGNFSDRPSLFAIKMSNNCSDIVFSNGPYWRRLRRICVNELLSAKRVKSLSSIRHEEVQFMLKWLSTFSDKSPIKVVEKVGEVASNIIARAVFGERCERQEILMKALNDLEEQISFISISDLFPSFNWLEVKTRTKFLQSYRILDKIVEEMINDYLQKKKQHQNDRDEKLEYDLVDALLKGMKDNNVEVPITFDSAKAVIMDMFSGGTDTAAVTIEWAMTELIKHPKIMAKVQEEIRHVANEKGDFDEHDLKKLNYLKLVIKETLRLHPPGPILIPRQCKETCQLLGYSIPSGARVLINAWALGRDPECWSYAEEFIPERFEGSSVDLKGQNFEFIPFGAGRRMCPGREFGSAVLEIVLARLLLHFDWKLPDGVKPNDIDMTEMIGAACRMKKPLALVPVLRVPLPGV